MKHLKVILPPLGILILIKLLFLAGFFDKLEFMAQDTLFRIRGPQPITEEVVVVGIDDASFNALKERWPFPRSHYAKLIENLTRAEARLIVFDIEFTEPSHHEYDEFLAQTAAAYQNVVFAGKIIDAGGMGIHQQLYAPIPAITDQGLSWGVVNLGVDPDGVMRKYALFHNFDKEPQYTIGVASLANYRVYQENWSQHIRHEDGKLGVADKLIPLHNHNEALINYFGPARYFPYLSFSSVLDDSTVAMPGQMGVETDDFEEILASGFLKDKIVLVGADTAELHDYFGTPFSASDWTPGVEIHANFIEMVLQGKYLAHINPWIYLGIEVLLLVLLWFVFRKLKPQWGAILVLVFIAAHFAVSYLVFLKLGLLIPIVQTALIFLLVYLVGLISHYLASLKEKRFIRNAFQQYLAPELVDKLLKDPKSLKYGGSLQEVTVLFSDIRSFTTYSENHKPEETVQILKEYLTAMVNTIVANDGILDKFVGDEIMALYGTPVPLPNPALSACKTALQMRDKLTELQQKWREEGREDFEIGIGINTGPAVVGNLGSEQIFDYTAIGDTINLGARLEGINKEYQTSKHIIISEFTLEKVQDLVETRYIDEVKVKGKNKAVKIYELIALK